MQRRWIARITSLALLFEILFPPFDVRSGSNLAVINLGYAYLFSPPTLPGSTTRAATVNVELLAVEVIVTFCIGWLLMFSTSGDHP